MALLGSLTSGVSGMQTFITGMEVIGNNIANVTTIGYKGARLHQSDTFVNTLRHASGGGEGSASQSGMQVGTGVATGSVSNNFEQGALNPTGVATDLGISGAGFFRVRDPGTNQEFVTRAGDFRIDPSGYLVTQQGFRVQGMTGGTISFTATEDADGKVVFTESGRTNPGAIGDIRINHDLSSSVTNSTSLSDAEVRAMAPGMNSFGFDRYGNVTLFLSNGDSYAVGRVLLQDFRDPSALMKEGNNLFSGFHAAGPNGGLALTGANNTPGQNGLGRIEEKTIEMSNVDLTDQFANMITTQRGFQASSRVVSVSDEILQEIVNLKR